MSLTNEPADQLSNIDVEPRRLPSTLNVLTILTFVGCGIGVFGAIFAFVRAQSNYDLLSSNSGNNVGQEFVRKIAGADPVEIARKSLENRVPILLLTLISIVLCILGAIVMRNLKKNGFYFYAVGEILPICITPIFVSTGPMVSITGIFGMIIPVVFLILYATQLKFMKK